MLTFFKKSSCTGPEEKINSTQYLFPPPTTNYNATTHRTAGTLLGSSRVEPPRPGGGRSSRAKHTTSTLPAGRGCRPSRSDRARCPRHDAAALRWNLHFLDAAGHGNAHALLPVSHRWTSGRAEARALPAVEVGSQAGRQESVCVCEMARP